MKRRHFDHLDGATFLALDNLMPQTVGSAVARWRRRHPEACLPLPYATSGICREFAVRADHRRRFRRFSWIDCAIGAYTRRLRGFVVRMCCGSQESGSSRRQCTTDNKGYTKALPHRLFSFYAGMGW
jgi:hypothetical protein